MQTETQKNFQAELERLEKLYTEAKIKADLELRSCTYDPGKWRRLANNAHRIAKQIDALKNGDLFTAPHRD